MTRLTQRVCLITGAAQGIGEAMAKVLAREGARLIISDINMPGLEQTADDIKAAGGDVTAMQLDVAEQSDWQAAQKTIAQTFGHLDVLVNNAGVEVVKPAEDTTLEDWRRVQRVNVDGVFLGCQTMLDLLKIGGQNNPSGASIINVSSVAGIVAFTDQVAYNTSKGAVRLMSKSLGLEFAEKRYNVRVNSVHPGFIDTPMLRDVFVRWANKGFMGDTPQAVQAAAAETQPLGRFGQPEDIANGVLFLACDESSFMSGAELVIDGAWTAK